MHRLLQVASFFTLAYTGLAQTTPFAITGSLDKYIVGAIQSTLSRLAYTRCEASGTEYNAGGFIWINNWKIGVPRNLIVQFPTVWAPFRELCGAGATGFETSVVGNFACDTCGQYYQLKCSEGLFQWPQSDRRNIVQARPQHLPEGQLDKLQQSLHHRQGQPSLSQWTRTDGSLASLAASA